LANSEYNSNLSRVLRGHDGSLRKADCFLDHEDCFPGPLEEDARPGGRMRRLIDEAKTDFNAGKTRSRP
jgi:hypothetical protein